jgi:phosphoribosylglycinamide formyltransferase 1
MRIAVLVSGGGTNLQILLDTCRDDNLTEIVLVASDRDGIPALDRATRAGVATHVFPDCTDAQAMLRTLRGAGVEFVVLAGYLRLVPEDLVRAYEGRMINIHPALLPSFGGKGMYGARVHRAVLESGATISGPTVHVVGTAYDRGPIVAQWPVPVLANDTPDSLAARVLDVEHQLLPAVVKAAARTGTAERMTLRGPAFHLGETVGQIVDALVATTVTHPSDPHSTA